MNSLIFSNASSPVTNILWHWGRKTEFQISHLVPLNIRKKGKEGYKTASVMYKQDDSFPQHALPFYQTG